MDSVFKRKKMMTLTKPEMLREQKTKCHFFLGSVKEECLNNKLSALKLKIGWEQAGQDIPVTPALRIEAGQLKAS